MRAATVGGINDTLADNGAEQIRWYQSGMFVFEAPASATVQRAMVNTAGALSLEKTTRCCRRELSTPVNKVQSLSDRKLKTDSEGGRISGCKRSSSNTFKS